MCCWDIICFKSFIITCIARFALSLRAHPAELWSCCSIYQHQNAPCPCVAASARRSFVRPNVSPPVCRLVCTANATWIPASCHEIHDRVLGYIKMLPLLSRMGRVYGMAAGAWVIPSLAIPTWTYTYATVHRV